MQLKAKRVFFLLLVSLLVFCFNTKPIYSQIYTPEGCPVSLSEITPTGNCASAGFLQYGSYMYYLTGECYFIILNTPDWINTIQQLQIPMQ